MTQPSLISALPAYEPGVQSTSRPGSAPAPAAFPATGIAPNTVKGAIANAAQRTGVDFDFLIAQAQVESAMNPDARARTSSAAGLYQFIESTWLETMQRHGDRFGLGNVAGQIGTGAGGKAQVSDPAQREAILAMRSDPQIASLMAAGLAQDNRAHLTPILGRQPDHGELYLAHFLGAGGAGRFLSAMADNPDQSAAALFSRPAAANRAIFYEGDGSARSLAGVMHVLDAKIQSAMMHSGTQPDPLTIAQQAIQTSDRAPFAPGNVSSVGMRNRPGLPSPASSNLPSGRPGQQAAPPISNVLRDTFGADMGAGNSAGAIGSGQSGSQIQRAYNQLKAFGL